MSAAHSVGPSEGLSGFGIVSTAAAVVGGFSLQRVGESSWKRERRLASLCDGYKAVLFGLVSVVGTLLGRVARIVRRTKKRESKGRYKDCPACVAASMCLTQGHWTSFVVQLVQCCGCGAYLMKRGDGTFHVLDLLCKPVRHYKFTEEVIAYGACANCGVSARVSLEKKGFRAREWKFKSKV